MLHIPWKVNWKRVNWLDVLWVARQLSGLVCGSDRKAEMFVCNLVLPWSTGLKDSPNTEAGGWRQFISPGLPSHPCSRWQGEIFPCAPVRDLLGSGRQHQDQSYCSGKNRQVHISFCCWFLKQWATRHLCAGGGGGEGRQTKGYCKSIKEIKRDPETSE